MPVTRQLLSRVALLLAAATPLPMQAAGEGEGGLVPHLDERGQAAYQTFLAATPHRAFAIAPGGGWGWSMDGLTPDLALEQALATCQAHTEQRCVPFAVDRRLVFDAESWPTLWRSYPNTVQADQAAPGILRGQRFPDLRLQDPGGEPWRLSEQRGRVVLLHFWGSWCPTCVHELPQFEQLQAAFEDVDDIDFVFTQVRESAATARAWLERQGLDLALHDSGAAGPRDQTLPLGDGGTIPDRELAPLFPATYVLDRHGLVVFGLRGSARDWMEFEPFIRDLLLD